jgi:Arc/MetJ family transcription regulator
MVSRGFGADQEVRIGAAAEQSVLLDGWLSRTIIRMKTTVELDEQKLLRVMELTGLKTRKEAIDFALSEAERAAKIAKLFARPRRSKDELQNLLDPEYDLAALRAQEKPRP